MAVCSFGKFPLRGLFQADWPFGTELYVRMLYVKAQETEALIAAVDSADTFPAETARFREGVARLTGIPADNIWYHELQLHAAPGSNQLKGESMERIIARAAAEALAMRARAVPFTCQVAEADVGTRFSVNREQYVEGLGGVTVWAGLDFDEQGRAYTQNPEIMLLRGYRPNLPVFDKPIYFDNPVDSKAYLFVFSDGAGRVIGTLSRFAAHPDVAVLFESILFDHTDLQSKYHYDYDWPGTISQCLEEAFGAPSLYLNGPCANLCTKKHYSHMDTYEAAAAECRRIGREIAAALLTRYGEKREALGDSSRLRAVRFSVELPMREDFPRSAAEALDGLSEKKESAERALRQAIERGDPAFAIKRLIDDRYRLDANYHYLYGVCGFDEETLKRHTVSVSVSALQLGDYLFIGVPGESLVEMGEWLRSTFTGAKTIPVDQVNGYYSYMATPTTLTLGGYTYWSSWVTRESIPVLKRAIQEKLGAFLAE